MEGYRKPPRRLFILPWFVLWSDDWC